MALARLIRGTRPFARQCNATLHPALAVRSQRLLLSSAPPSTILDDPHIFPDQVLEEEKTGFPVGLPQIKEEQLWKPGAEGTLLAERAELWWDDGTAEPEWFVDRGSAGGSDGGRPWAVSNSAAVAQLAGAIAFIGVVIGGASFAMGDTLRPAAPRWDHAYPVDMRAQFGLQIASCDDDEE